ncbi:MAG TPA: tetratricopeptide repeat protein [Candidatus Angelobacter sp.]|jgi:tetratricopeptide (TPR) repeat protein|nr:tetratricopeptide repeat protein [Candidatus Angelobacter sp.]
MKKSLSLVWLLLLIASGLFPCQLPASDADYQQGMKALSSNDFSTALRYLELAVAGDPDNLRYGSDYRQAIIRSKEFDRALKFFDQATAQHPKSANLRLNYGFAYVDKIPAAGSITQVILANNALTEFTRSLELKPSWIAYYTRGTSYLFWPKIFKRAALGVADLQRAMEIQKSEQRHRYHVKAYIALGDGYWKTDDLVKARVAWEAGLKEFPASAALQQRLSLKGDELKNLIEAQFDPAARVNTDLRDLWTD